MRSHAMSIAVATLLSITFVALVPATPDPGSWHWPLPWNRTWPSSANEAAETATIFTVNSTGDEVDSSAGDGACRTAAGACTLRAAIEEANARAGADSIHFGIGSGARSISPTTPLPVIFEEVEIDGSTQPGFAGSPLIELNGSAIKVEDVREGPGIDGLVLVNGKITVRALAISAFGGAALVLTEGDANRIEGCWIGTGPSGVEDKGNGGDGIVILRSSDNIIGGVEARQRNLIAGNDGRGILISDGASSDNIIQGNIVGIAADGTASPNGSQGILILGAPNNLIGGSVTAAGNVIAGNAGNGIEVSGSSALGNRIEGNLVGARGADDPGNKGTGIVLDSAPNNVVGGAPEARNWIAGNGGDGIAILGGGARGNSVAGNLIGIASDGGVTRGNDGDGILIAGAPENTIGGPVSALLPPIDPTSDPGATTDPSATPTPTAESTGGPPLPSPDPPETSFPPPSTPIGPPPMPPPIHSLAPLVMPPPIDSIAPPSIPDPSHSITIRASEATSKTHAGNVIGNSSGDGIEISGTGARANRIIGNLIGIDSDGRPAGNLANGIFVTDAPENVIGGDSVLNEGNAIGASARNGIAIVGIGSTGNRLEGNVIGTRPMRGSPRVLSYDVSGTLSNEGEGVLILGAPANSIGAGPDPESIGIPPAPGFAPPSTRGNVIAGNSGDGVRIAGDGADGNKVAWNAIGILGGSSGDVLIGNGGDGVAVVGGARRNHVTGSTVIASVGHGVSITGAGTDQNVISGNRLGAAEVGGNGVEGASAAGDGALVRAGAARNELSDNEIEANLRHGIHLHGTGTEGNVVAGNRISAMGGAGIMLAAGASGNRIGGAGSAGAGFGGEGNPWSNRVHEHLAGGIVLAEADENRLLWNSVAGGPGVGGDSAGAAEPSEPTAGIMIKGTRNVIGPGNLVSHQRGDGIVVVGTASTQNRLFGNWIGLDSTGAPAGNGGSGVRVSGAASNNMIGSTETITSVEGVVLPGRRPPRGNVIAHNSANGVRLDSGTGNVVAANNIYANSGLAIDLGGDGRGSGEPGAADAANRAQAAPEWRGEVVRADSVRGSAGGRPGRALRLELFVSRRCEPDGDGDAEVPLARLDITVGDAGLGPFDLDLTPLAAADPTLLIGRALSATATDLDGNTSELSRCAALLVPQVYVPVSSR